MTTLVLGGTGKTGRRVADRLTALGLPVRIGSRSAEPPFDWADRATWVPALRGVASVYISYFPDMAAPGAAEAIGALANQAVRASGVRRLVLLSGRGEEEGLPAEQAVRDAGAEWTILRSTWFAQNFSEAFLLEPVLAGEIVFPAAAHVRRAATEISTATGRPIRYVPVSVEEFASILGERAVPATYVEFLTHLFTKVLDGRNAHLTDGVQQALGRPPRDFAEYAHKAAATGVWQTPAL